MAERAFDLSHIPPAAAGTAKVRVRRPDGNEEVIEIGAEPVRLEPGTTILEYLTAPLSIDLGHYPEE